MAKQHTTVQKFARLWGNIRYKRHRMDSPPAAVYNDINKTINTLLKNVFKFL